jgi:hypothetical protein
MVRGSLRGCCCKGEVGCQQLALKFWRIAAVHAVPAARPASGLTSVAMATAKESSDMASTGGCTASSASVGYHVRSLHAAWGAVGVGL